MVVSKKNCGQNDGASQDRLLHYSCVCSDERLYTSK